MSLKMKVLKNREEWLHHRQDYIGGSDASAIVACNPYMSNVDLWEIKTGRMEQEDISDKPYVKYGVQAEPLLRELFKIDFPQYEVKYEENNSFTNDRYPWAAASLDGWLIDRKTGRKGILEIKTTEILRSQQKEQWDHRVPNGYFCQLCHCLAVTEFEFAILKCQMKTVFNGIPYLQTRHYTVEREEIQDDIDYLMNEEERFWEYVKNRKRPPMRLLEI